MDLQSTRVYARWAGALLAVLGLLGLLWGGVVDMLPLGGGLKLGLHLITGLVGLLVGFAGMERYADLYAWLMGILYTLLGVVGLMLTSSFLGLELAWLLSLVYLLVGLWGLWAAWSTSRNPRMATRGT